MDKKTAIEAANLLQEMNECELLIDRLSKLKGELDSEELEDIILKAINDIKDYKYGLDDSLNDLQ